MERPELLAFLEAVGAGSLESYLSQHGDDPLLGLEERVQWAAWNFRDPENAREASFLMQNHDALRAVLDEGETAWHLRIKREERAARGNRSVPPPPPRGISGTVKPSAPESSSLPGRTVAGKPSASRSQTRSLLGSTGGPGPAHSSPSKPLPVVPAPAPPLTPAPLASRAVSSSDVSHPPIANSGPPSFSKLPPAGKPPPLSEAVTAIREKDEPAFEGHGEATQGIGAATARKLPKQKRGGESFRPKSHMPTGLDRTIPDLESERSAPDRGREGLGLGIEKTAWGDTGTPMPTRVRYDEHPNHGAGSVGGGGGTDANMSFLMLGIGLAVAGMGLLALAGAIVFAGVQNAETPPPPPPRLEGTMPEQPSTP